MQAQFPGGRQGLSVNPMSQVPGNPLSSITPGQFPHNTTGVGSTGLGPASTSPGMRVAPGTTPSTAITPNKGTFLSNEVVVQPLTTKSWIHTEYQKYQRRGDLMMVRRETGDHPKSSAACNLAQLAEMLRDGYKKLVSQVSLDPKTLLLDKNTPIREVNDKVKKLYEQYLLHGEVALTADDEVRKKIQMDKHQKLLMFVSKEHIREAYNLGGVYMSDGGREIQQHIVLNIGVKGPTTYQEVVNYWGNVHEGQHLYLILCPRLDTQRSLPGKSVYAEWYWKTWSGFENYPPDELLRYIDPAGIVHRALVWHVGYVVYTPQQWNDNGMIQMLLGNTATSLEAFGRSAYARKVAISLGTPKHRFDIWAV